MNASFVYSYSSFLFEMSIKEKRSKQYYKQICAFLQLLTDSQLTNFLSNFSIDKDQRKKIFKSLFSKKLDDKIIYFVWTIIDFNRINYLEKILRSYLQIYDDYYGISFVKVYSPFELTNKQLNKIKLALQKKFKKDIILENIIDPSVIGGIKIESKNLSIDNTFKKARTY